MNFHNPKTAGQARFFGGPPDGVDPTTAYGSLISNSCGYGRISLERWPQFQVISLAADNPLRTGLPLSGCGMCLQVRCTDTVCLDQQPVTFYMVDTCDTCNATDISVSALGFEKLAPLRLGQIDVEYMRVDCDPANSNIIIRVDTNRESGGGWVRLSIQNIAGGGLVQSVSLIGSDGIRRPMDLSYGASWELSGTPPLPWALLFTTDDGQIVQVQGVVTHPGQIGLVDSGVQIALNSLPPRPLPAVAAPGAAGVQVDGGMLGPTAAVSAAEEPMAAAATGGVVQAQGGK